MYEPPTRLTGADLQRHVRRHDCTIGEPPKDERAQAPQWRDTARRCVVEDYYAFADRLSVTLRPATEHDAEDTIWYCDPRCFAAEQQQEVADRRFGYFGSPCG